VLEEENKFNLGECIMSGSELVDGLIYFGLSMAVFGALITAVLHGFGFSIFGYKEIRPSFLKRWLLSFIAGVIVTALLYLMGDTITLTPANMSTMIIIYVLVVVAINHLTLSAVTYFLFNAKGNNGAALKTPLMVSGFLLVIYLVPSIWFASKM